MLKEMATSNMQVKQSPFLECEGYTTIFDVPTLCTAKVGKLLPLKFVADSLHTSG